MRVKDARQTFLGWWIRQVIEGREIQVFGSGRQFRDFTYVDDVGEAFLLAASDACKGEIFNIGGDGPISLLDLSELLVSINGSGRFALVPFPPEFKAIDIGDFYADDWKLRSWLGWRPKTSLRDGLTRTLEYCAHWRH